MRFASENPSLYSISVSTLFLVIACSAARIHMHSMLSVLHCCACMRLCHFHLCHYALASSPTRCQLLACMPVYAYTVVRYSIGLYTNCYQLFLLFLQLYQPAYQPVVILDFALILVYCCTGLFTSLYFALFFLQINVLHSHTGISKRKVDPFNFGLWARGTPLQTYIHFGSSRTKSNKIYVMRYRIQTTFIFKPRLITERHALAHFVHIVNKF